MKLKWEKYWYDLGSSVLKHIGTSWGAWTGTNAISAAGFDVPALNLTHLGIFTVTAGVIPAISSFWSKTPLPEIEETTITVTTTKSQPDQSPNETTPPHPSPPHDPPLSG